jgi:hypothetical protein
MTVALKIASKTRYVAGDTIVQQHIQARCLEVSIKNMGSRQFSLRATQQSRSTDHMTTE